MGEAISGANPYETAKVGMQIDTMFGVQPYQEGDRDDRDSANLDARIQSAVERGDILPDGTLSPAMRDGMDPGVAAVFEHLLQSRLAKPPENER